MVTETLEEEGRRKLLEGFTGEDVAGQWRAWKETYGQFFTGPETVSRVPGMTEAQKEHWYQEPEWYREPGTYRWKKLFTTPEGDVKSIYDTPPEWLYPVGEGRIYFSETPPIPTEPIFISPERAAEAGFEMPEGWQLKLTPDDVGEFTQTLIDPQGQEVAFGDISFGPEGQWMTGGESKFLQSLYIPPELRITEGMPPFERIRAEQAIASLPELERLQVEQAQQSLQGFLTSLETEGATPENIGKLRLLDPTLTEEDIEGMFGESKVVSGIAPRPLREMLLGGFKISEQPIEDISAFADKDYDQFVLAMKYEGRNPKTEAILRTLHEGITDKEVQDFFEISLPIRFARGDWLPPFLQEYWQAYQAGTGSLLEMGAGVAGRLGHDGLSTSLMEIGLKTQMLAKDVDYGDPYTPEWFAKRLTNTIPFMLAITAASLVAARGAQALVPVAAPAVVSGAGGVISGSSWTASTILGGMGASGFLKAVVGTLTAGIVSTLMESSMEAGDGYNEAVRRGFTQEQANRVYDYIVRGNIQVLSLSNTIQYGVTFFLPGGWTGRFLVKSAIYGMDAVLQAMEEGGQHIIAKDALGEDVDLDDPELWQAVSLGFGGGLSWAGAGHVFSLIKSRTKGKMPPEQINKFQADIAGGLVRGLSTEEAEMKAWDFFAETEEGKTIITEAIEEIRAEEDIENAKIEPTPLPLPADPEALAQRRLAQRRLEEAAARIEAVPEVEYKVIGRMASGEANLLQTPEGHIVERIAAGKQKGWWKVIVGDTQYVAQTPQRAIEIARERGAIPEAMPIAEVPLAKPPAVEEVRAIELVPEVEAVETKVRRQLTGLGRMYQEWWGKLKTAEQTKVSLAKFVKENLPLNVRGKYISAVARVKTDAQLQTQMARVQEVAEQNAQKVLKAEIRKEIKKARAKVKEHILKGKFTPEVQRRLDVLTHNLDLDRDAAREKIAQNIIAYEEGKLGYEEMLNDNEMLNFAGIDGMSAEELANTLEYIKILETIGKSERQAKQERATEKINVIRSDISNILTGGQGLKTGIGAVPTGELIAKTGWWDVFTNWQYGIDNLADKISKLDPTSKPYQSALSQFVAEVHRATHRQIAGKREILDKLRSVIKEVYKVKSNREVNHIANSLEEEVDLGVFELTEEYKANHPGATTVTIKMTRNQMIAKYMQMQDPTLNDTFTTGMGWSQDVKDAVVNNLTAEEKKLADAIFDFYKDYYTATNEIYQELFNVDMPHNPNYSPIRRDFEADIVENVLTMRDASQYASVLNGSLKARQRNIRPLRFNGALDILSNHIDQMEHFKAWATTMRDMRRVFGNKEIRQAVEQYHGRGVLRLIDTFLNQMARGGIETAATNRAADFLRLNFTRSILAIKPVILMKQIPSLFAYISEMNAVDFFGGVADYWTAPIQNFKFLYNNSKMYRARIGEGFERDIRAALKKHGKTAISGRGKATDWFLLQIRLGDAFAVTQGMWAKYKAGLKEGLTQEGAIAAAEDTTGRTQPSFGIDTLSAIQNGGSWLKLMTMFQNQPNKYFRIVGDNLRNFKYGRGSRAKAGSTILLAWVILPMMFQFIADAFQWKPERQARAGILGPLNFILIGGQMVQSMWGWLTDQPFGYQVSPVAQTGRDLQMIFLKAKKLISQGFDPYKDITVDDVAALVEYLAKATGQVIGLPTPYFVQVSKLIRHKMQAGEELEIKDFLFSEWALQPPPLTAEEQVEELNLKLGELEEGQEDKPLSDKPLKVYDTADWLRDIGSVYKSTLPQDIVDDPNASSESKAWAEYELARSKSDILPNIALYKINTEDNDDTIIEYYAQWKAREKITSLAELREFDKLYPKAYLGNVTRQQYSELTQYLKAEDKDAFLEAHPGLRVNPRNEWLKANPTDNARLALGGQAKILTIEAYNEFNRLLKELDVPDAGIPAMTLPPLTSIETHFAYEDFVEDGKHGSWEAQLLLLKDAEAAKEAGVESYAEWHDLTLSDTPMRALELKVKHRKLSDEYGGYGDKDSPFYIEDDEDRKAAREKLEADNPQWVDDKRRIEAIENEATDAIVEQWVERGRLVDEFTGGSSEVKVWFLDNPEAHKWAREVWSDKYDSSDWNEPVLRINAEWRVQDDEHEGYGDKDSPHYIEDKGKRAEKREWYLGANPEYAMARRRREAYGEEGAKGERFTEAQIDQYVEYYSLDAKGQRQERYLKDNPDFAQAMHVVAGIDIPDPSTVPAVQYDEIYEAFQDEFEILDGLDNHLSRHYIEDIDARKRAREALRYRNGKPTEFYKAEIRREAYGKFFDEKEIGNYVTWYTDQSLKKPANWPENLEWFEDDWFLMEHGGFYGEMRAKGIFTVKRDFRLVPTRKVFDLYLIYRSPAIPLGAARIAFRTKYLELNDWLILAKGLKPLGGRTADVPRLSEWEEMAKRLRDLEERIRKL